MIPLAGNVNFESGWTAIWSAVEGAVPGLSLFLNIIGAGLVVFAIAKYLWDKRKGQGGDNKGLVWTLVVGALFAAPAIVIPICLKFASWAVNFGIGLFSNG